MKALIYGIVSKITASERQLFYKEVGGRVNTVLDMDLIRTLASTTRIPGTFSVLTSKSRKTSFQFNSIVVRNKQESISKSML